MNAEIKKQVIRRLETYPDRARQIALLHYEMRHMARVSPEEVIGGMSLSRSDSTGGSGKGRVSNKTMYIALNYQEKTEQMNAEAANDIAQRLLKLEAEQDRIRYYVSLLEKREAEAIRLTFLMGSARTALPSRLASFPAPCAGSRRKQSKTWRKCTPLRRTP